MKMLKRLMAGILSVGLLVSSFEIVYAACAGSDIECFTVGGTQKFRIDTSGNVEAAGTLAVTGTQTFTGATTFSGAVTAGSTLTANGAVTLSTTTLRGGLAPYSVTVAQVNASTPTAVGQLVFCSDCTNFNAVKGTVCMSTGTTTGAYIAISSATAVTNCR